MLWHATSTRPSISFNHDKPIKSDLEQNQPLGHPHCLILLDAYPVLPTHLHSHARSGTWCAVVLH